MSIYELAEWYGSEMQKFGMSYYNEIMKTVDPTDKLLNNDLFKALSEEEKDKILQFGKNMRMYGMGKYAEHGACAEYYQRRGGRPPENPFKNQKSNAVSEPERN